MSEFLMHRYYYFTQLGWTTEINDVTLPSFTEDPGPTVTLLQSSIEIFNIFFSDDLIQLVVRETNRYHQQTSPLTSFETTEEEILAYFGFMMGINKLPESRDYWASDDCLHFSPIANKISRSRFEDITRYLHFIDNITLPERGSNV